jgi:photosystem II stability/assembly factor-like uncharacterized protein
MIINNRSNYVMRAILLALMIFCHCESRSQIRLEVLRDEFRDDKQYEYKSIDCSDKNNCTAVCREYNPDSVLRPYKVMIERTTDGGVTWQFQEPGIPNYGDFRGEVLRKVCAIDSANIMCVGDSGLILRTTNAGKTWVRQDIGKKQWIDVSFSDPMNGIIVSFLEAYKTTDGGEHWSLLPTPVFGYLCAGIAFSHNEYQIFRYGTGPMYRTTDGGNSWIASDTIPDLHIDSIRFRTATVPHWLSQSHIIIGGGHEWDVTLGKPYIVMTQDSGRNWTTVYDDSVKGFYGGLRSLAINGNGAGIAVGNGSSALLTTNNGLTWSPHQIDIDYPSYYYTSACFADDNTLFLVGTNAFLGRILKADFSKSFVAINVPKITNGTTVYPNPADEYFRIASTVKSFNVTYSLYDILGRKVLDIIPQEHNNAFVENIKLLTSGMYSLIANYDGVPVPVKMLSVMHQ